MATRIINCPLCGSPATDRMTLKHATVRQCTSPKCQLRFADPQPTTEALSAAYSDLYYPTEAAERQPQFGNTPEPTLRQLFQGLEKRIGDLRGLRLLDYGCGRGALLRVAMEFGMQVAGIEPDPQARSVAASVSGETIYPSIADLSQDEPEAQFDVVILWTVIEHLRIPWVELARLRRLLRPNGTLVISTMDIRCLRARIEGPRWENYENPTHLYYFDRVSLAQAIREAGFTDFSEWRLKIRYPQHGLMRWLFYEFCFSLRMSDGLFFLCRGTSNGNHGDTAAESSGIRQEPHEYSHVARLPHGTSRS